LGLGGAIIIAIFWFAAFFIVTSEQERETANSEEEATQLARFFEDQTVHFLRYADSYIKSVRREYVLNTDLEAVRRFMTEVPLDNSVVSHITIFDHLGTPILNSSKKKIKPGSTAKDRQYFQRTIAYDSDQLYISLPHKGRNTGKVTLRLVRQIRSREGEVIGIMFAAIEDVKIVSFFNAMKLGPKSSATLVGTDKKIRARSSYGRLGPGQDISGSRIWKELAQSPQGIYRQTSVVDGVTRSYAYRKLADYPLITAIGRATDDIEKHMLLFKSTTYGFVLFITISFFVLFFRVRRERAFSEQLGKAHDILETRVAERTQELQQSEQQLRDFGASASDWYWEMDENLRFSYFSDSFTEITGVPQSKLLGKTRQEDGNPGVDPADWQGLLDDLAAHRQFRNFVHGRTKSGGEEIWLSINGKPVFDVNGAFRGYRGTGLDITDGKNTQDQLVAAKEDAERANQIKSEFLSAMSHELRTPLNSVLGFGQLLETVSDDPLSEDQRDSVHHILKNGRHLLALINDVLDLSRIEAEEADLSIENVLVTDVIDECLQASAALAGERNIQISFDKSRAEGLLIVADYRRLKQILLNLLSNAVKYNRDEGTVTIDVEKDGEHGVRIAVTDSGEGVPKNNQSELFKPFSRLSAENSEIEGTGIGLVVCKNLVELMHGEIGMTSEAGKGSTFWFELPLGMVEIDKLARTEEKEAVPESTGFPHISGKLLYVEDNPANLYLMEKIVSRITGLTMISARNGKSGVDLAVSEEPDIIILDINLPDINGDEVLRTLRSYDKLENTPILALSAAATQADIDKGLAAGFLRYLTKPIDVHEFSEAIKSVLNIS
jgi:PAS domain S-box-containing protein